MSETAPAKPAAPSEKPKQKRCPAQVPAALDPAPDLTLELALPANGVQIYSCSSAQPNSAPAWTLEAPHAVLTRGGQVVASHFAGPSWQALDGSLVKGAKLAAADAPVASAVPWLLLSATPSGPGTFGKIEQIQRLETEGGKAPAVGCDAAHVGAKVLVPYRANYYFYRKRAEGEHARQCRSKSAKRTS